MQILGAVVIVLIAVVIFFMLGPLLFGMVRIGERQVGIVVKKFARRNLPAGRLVALNGEAGFQADTLSPGVHFGYYPWQYSVRKVQVTEVPQGQIALIVAADGAAIPSERMLGRVVDSDNFQSARKFLMNGGEKGRQLGILTAGTYRINTELFNVITVDNATDSGMTADELMVYEIEPDKVGIVTTLDGQPIDQGEIAGPLIPGHNNFQDAQTFLANGGRRGLQEQVLLSGAWNLNPWIVQVEQVPMTQVPIGYVGVVISYVGSAHEDVSGLDFKHGDLVNQGHKGVWVVPLYPGKHPLNTRVMKVELVPTTNIVLNWANRTEAHSYDKNLSSITVRSQDGFAFSLDVAQIIHVGALDAPKVISRVGAMQNLVDHVLQPIVGNYFRNSAQDFTVLDFLSDRSGRQNDAAEHIRKAVAMYDVQAIDTLIGDITPPPELMETQTDRKIAEEQKKTFEVQEAAQKQRQQLVRETSIAEIQKEMVRSEQSVRMSDLEAQANIKRANGEAEAIRVRAIGESEALRARGLGEADAIRSTGQAKAEAYRVGVESLGVHDYTALQLMQIIGTNSVRVVPDVAVNGANTNGGLIEALMGTMLQKSTNGAPAPNGSPTLNGETPSNN